MKRLFAVLVVLCLILCGCEAGSNTPTQPNTPGQSGGEQTTDPTSGQSAEPTRPTDVELVDFDAPALKVKITINPELELTLSRTNEILDVKALNADAEGLLAGMDLVGQTYARGIVTILEEAKEQKYLKDVSKVTITAEELSDGAWTIITGELLTQPIEDYQQNSGVVFSCRLTPAGESLDIDGLKVIDTSRTEGVSVTVYGDAYGNAKMMIYESDDGTRQEVYMISDTEVIGIHYYPDGSYRYGHNDGLVDQGYWVYPDGSGFTYVEYRELVDGLTQPVWYQKTYFDGSAEEYFYENSEWVRTVFTNADGSTWEAFYENGTIVSEVWKDADGNILAESGGNGDSAGTNPDGSTFEQTLYPSGSMKTYDITWPNGDYQKLTYYENGNTETYIEFREGRYVEGYYDENGLMVSLFQREPDGTEYDWEYENGEPVSYTVTYPDGSTTVYSLVDGSTSGTYADGSTFEQTRYPNGNLKTNNSTSPNGDYHKLTYYENGNVETDEALQDGTYRVAYYDENGMLTSTFQRDAEGIESKIEYQDGNIISDIITWPNGDYEQYTFYENGLTATQIGMSNGNYFENFYDENGLMVSSFNRHSDGTEYDWDYENGEAVGYTVTYSDGSSEYHNYSP